MSTDKLKTCEIEMKPNQAYETVSLPNPSQSSTQVHTKPCPAYEVVVQAHHWGWHMHWNVASYCRCNYVITAYSSFFVLWFMIRDFSDQLTLMITNVWFMVVDMLKWHFWHVIYVWFVTWYLTTSAKWHASWMTCIMNDMHHRLVNAYLHYE